jgi:hypothetical protein
VAAGPRGTPIPSRGSEQALDVPAAHGQDARATAVAAVPDRRRVRAAFAADLFGRAMACPYSDRRSPLQDSTIGNH